MAREERNQPWQGYVYLKRYKGIEQLQHHHGLQGCPLPPP